MQKQTDHSFITSKDMLDITAPQSHVEVSIRKDSHVLWVNIDGVCKLRVCRITHLVIDDQREENKHGQ